MKAVISKMSPHNFLSCCLKFCTASAHLTFSEASPPTCHFKDQREDLSLHSLCRATDLVSKNGPCMLSSRKTQTSITGPVDQWGFVPAAANMPVSSPCAAHCVGCGRMASLECTLSGSALSRFGVEPTHLQGLLGGPNMSVCVYVDHLSQCLSAKHIRKLCTSLFPFSNAGDLIINNINSMHYK